MTTRVHSNALVVYQHQDDISFQNERLITMTNNLQLRLEQSHAPGTGSGGILWQTALAMIDFFMVSASTWKGKQILELGSGTGCLGLALHQLEANVVLTDQPSLLSLLERNSARNQNEKMHTRARVAELNWGKPTDLSSSKWDVIVGSDITYHPESIPELIETLLRFMSDSTLAYIGHTHRYASRTTYFLEQFQQNFNVQEIKWRRLKTYGGKQDQYEHFHLYEITRNHDVS